MRLSPVVAAFAAAACVFFGTASLAADDPRDGDIGDLRLGTAVEDMPDGFMAFACGTNGGPPSRPIDGWQAFRQCPTDASGLREIYIELDDELEYEARAAGMLDWVERFGGTKVAGQPVILSVLFDDAGVLQGIRIVTDPRGDERKRRGAFLLGNRLKIRYDTEGWLCEDLPRAEGEAPIGNTFVKERCEKVFNDDRLLTLETRLYRKPGPSRFEGGEAARAEVAYENSTRLDIRLLPKETP